MSPKKAILQALVTATDGRTPSPEIRPSTIPGYGARAERFQEAVNELLRARLVEGRKNAEGQMTIALNEHRRRDVERILRPLWARPAIWAGLALLLAIGAGLVAV